MLCTVYVRYIKLGRFPAISIDFTNEFTNDFIVIDSFYLIEEIVDQQLDFFIVSSDVGSLFNNISQRRPLKFAKMNFSKNLKPWKAKTYLSLKSFYLLLLKIHNFFLMEHFINKLMVWPWASPKVLR